MGATPQMCAQAASERIRCGVVAGGDEEDGRGVGAGAVDLEEAGGGRW